MARSKLTVQGQISVPAEVRKKLGLGPGSILEWEERGDEIVVRRAGRYSSVEINAALFPQGPPETKTAKELKQGLAEHIRKRHARR